MSRHTISRADSIYAGSAYNASYHGALGNTTGVLVSLPVYASLGTPEVADPNFIMDAATSTQLPDTETVTYTTADDGTAPFDNVDTPVVSSITTSTGETASVWALDVPRNLTTTTTHSTSIVAMTVTVTGYDTYKVKMVEAITVAAGGTNEIDSGLKAFAYVESIAITAAGDAEANTCSLGFGDVLGLPFAVDAESKLLPFFDGNLETTGVFVAAVTTDPATSTTGDVRGTYNPNGTLNGSVAVAVWMIPSGMGTTSAFGVAQYGG